MVQSVASESPGVRSISARPAPHGSAVPKAVQELLAKNRLASARYVADLSLRKNWLSKHRFLIEADLCIDGRVMDFPHAIGLRVGLLEPYRSAGSRAGLNRLSYKQRTLAAMRKAANLEIDGMNSPHSVMRMRTVHFSGSREREFSCAAWGNDTESALVEMQLQSVQLNRAFPGKMIAFPVLVDTDRDALTFVGPKGRIDVSQLMLDAEIMNGDRAGAVERRLRGAFTADWEALRRFDVHTLNAFYRELTERVLANLDFVQRIVASNRPPDLLDHREKIVFVGRHVDWMDPADHNTIFLIDDCDERTEVLRAFQIAMQYVARTVIQEAMGCEDRDWVIPVLVNIPHDGSEDEDAEVVYAKALLDDLAAHVDQSHEALAKWLLSGNYGIRPDQIPDWMFRQIHGIRERVCFVGSRSYRKDRLFRPFTHSVG